MTRSNSLPARLAAPVLFGALIAPFLLGEDVLVWSLLWGGTAIVSLLWSNALARSEQVLEGLRLVWMELPGAIRNTGRIEVHDGTYPLTIELRKEKSCLIAALSVSIGDSPVTFRIWPTQPRALPGPPWVEPSVAAVLERSAILEQLLAGRFHVQTNNEEQVQRLLGREVMRALFDAIESEPGSFGGLSYDGSTLSIHLTGAVVANPTRAAAIARPLWRGFVV